MDAETAAKEFQKLGQAGIEFGMAQVGHSKRDTVIEWLHCLLSPKHAQHTWLRVSTHNQDRALAVLQIIVVLIGLGAALSVHRAYNAYQLRQYYHTHPQVRVIHLGPNERFN